MTILAHQSVRLPALSDQLDPSLLLPNNTQETSWENWLSDCSKWGSIKPTRISVFYVFFVSKDNSNRFYYATVYSKNSGWALSITPVPYVCLSVRLSVRPTSCPGHNSQTLWNIFMKLHRCIHHTETMCHEQGRQLLHFWFLNYFLLT